MAETSLNRSKTLGGGGGGGGKGEIAHYEQFLLFPKVFSQDLYYRHVKPWACLGKG